MLFFIEQQFRNDLQQLTMGSCMQKKHIQRESNENNTVTRVPTRRQITLTTTEDKGEAIDVNNLAQTKHVQSKPVTLQPTDGLTFSTVGIQLPKEENSPIHMNVTQHPAQPNQRNSYTPNINVARSQSFRGTGSSRMTLGDSMTYLDSNKHHCIVKRPSLIDSSSRMIDLQNSQNIDKVMGSNMQLRGTVDSVKSIYGSSINNAL